MRHFHRCSLSPDAVLATADAFFPALGLAPTATGERQGADGQQAADASGHDW